MIPVTKTYVKYSPSPILSQKNKSYILFIPDSGPVGDKFNMGPSSTGVQFPSKATQRFAFKRDAERVRAAFIKYCNAKIADALTGKLAHTPSGLPEWESKVASRKPSYFFWN